MMLNERILPEMRGIFPLDRQTGGVIAAQRMAECKLCSSWPLVILNVPVAPSTWSQMGLLLGTPSLFLEQ